MGIYPKELKAGTQTETCTTVFIASLFTIVKGWKKHKCSSPDKQINEMCYTCAVGYYSSFKMKEILTHAVTWMNLEDIGHYT